MKKIILLPVFLICLLYSVRVSAQYCGGSGSTVCSTLGSPLTQEGFYPSENDLPCVVDGIAYDTVIQIRTPPTATQGGSSYTLSKIKVTSVTNLPCGMCWQLGDGNNEIQGNADGCMRVKGITLDAPGEYLMNITVDATVSIGGFPYTVSGQNLSSQGLRFYARVKLPGAACPVVDTLAAGNTASASGGNAPIPTISGAASVCTGGNSTLSVSGGAYYGYVWSTGALTSSINVTNSGTYTVTVYENCSSATATKTVTVNASPTVVVSPGSTTVCSGIPTVFTASGGATYSWSNSSTSAAITVTPNNTTTYTVTVTSGANCSASSSVTLTVNPSASVSVSPTTDTVCGNTPTTITATGTGTYTWSTGATTAAINVSPANTTNYTVTITNSNSCSATAIARIVTKSAGSTISATGPTTFCVGGSVTLKLDSTAGTYVWSTGATTSTVTVNQSGTYNATVTVNGCTASTNSLNVTVGSNLTPTITANPSLNICPGGSATLDAGAGYTNYTWSNSGGTHQTTTVTSGGTYTVTVSSGTCNGSATATVVVGNFPLAVNVSPAGPVTACQGDTISLNAGSGFASYAWSNGSQVAVTNATISGDYAVTVTKNACIGVDTVHVTVNPKPVPVVLPAGPLVKCTGDTALLDAGAGFDTYTWSDGENTQTIQPGTTGVYGVSVTLNGCGGVAALPVSVTFNALPSPVISPAGELSICSGSDVRLTADAGYSSYLWSTGATSQSITVNAAGVYNVSVTQNGCMGFSTSSNVSVVTKPVAAISSSASSNGSAYLSASPASASYQWLVQTSPNGSFALTANTNQFDTVSCGNSATYYSVIVTQSGCSDTSVQHEVVCTGINEVSSLVNFMVHPNPATDVMYINYELNTNTAIHLSVIDLTGRRVMDVVNTSEVKGVHEHQIKLTDLSAGVYLLNFVTDNGSFNTKFVKQ